MSLPVWVFGVCMGFALLPAAGGASEEKFNQVGEAQAENHQQARLSQQKITTLAEKTHDLLTRYRSTLRDIDRLREHNQHLKTMIAEQKKDEVSIRRQIKEIKKTRRQITPFMLEMYKNLKEFVKRDIPFLKKEREQRLTQLQNTLNRADVTISEKYRKIMEAYQIEQDYGTKIDSYQGTQNIQGAERSVKYLRVGRLVFVYQSLDNKHQAFWDHRQRAWVTLPSRYRRVVDTGVKMFKKQISPTFLTLPVQGPTDKKIATGETL